MCVSDSSALFYFLPLLSFYITYLILFTSCLYLNCLLCLAMNVAIIHHLPCLARCRSMRFNFMQWDIQICVQVILQVPSMIDIACCTILRLMHGSSSGCPVVNGARLFGVASPPKCIVHSPSVMKMWIMRSSFGHLSTVISGRRYQRLIDRLSSGVFHFVTPISLSFAIIWRMTATLGLIYISMPGGYFQGCVKLNCLLFHHCISRIIPSNLPAHAGS